MSFGRRLASIRDRESLQQKELAKLIGVKHRNVSDYERDLYFPKPKVLAAIARELNVSLDYLLGVNEDEASYKKYKVIYLEEDVSKEMEKEILEFIQFLKLKYNK